MTVVAAWALRWGHVSRSTQGQFLRTRRGCLDQWLAEQPEGVPVLIGHGRRVDDFETCSDLLSEPIGRVRWFQDSDVGLFAESVYDDDNHLAVKAMDAIRAGTVTAYSCHLRVLEVEESGDVTADGEAIFDIARAELVECGPTHDPDDEGALITTIDGEITPGGEYLRSESSGRRNLGEVLDRIASAGLVVTVEDAADRRRAARQRVDHAEWVASQLAKARRNAESAYADARSPWRRRDDLDRAHQFEREADQLDTELRDLLCNNQEVYDSLAAEFRVPPKVNLIDRLKALA